MLGSGSLPKSLELRYEASFMPLGPPRPATYGERHVVTAGVRGAGKKFWRKLDPCLPVGHEKSKIQEKKFLIDRAVWSLHEILAQNSCRRIRLSALSALPWDMPVSPAAVPGLLIDREVWYVHE